MQIPVYPATRPLALIDKPLLDQIFQSLQPSVSELSFAGLYLFRTAHQYRLTLVEDALVVLGQGYDSQEYFLPPLNGSVAKALDRLFAEGYTLYGADEAFVSLYLGGRNLLIEEDRDSFDYVYLRDDLANLPGNRFHKKRNRIAYFTSRHHSVSVPYAAPLRHGCLELLELWKRTARSEGAGSSLEFEAQATAEALHLSGELCLSGVVVLVEEQVKAFALGERLNPSTAVCHFEKSDPFLEGVAQLVNRDFSRMLFADCRYVNREQDLGDQGLRRAKLSYHPGDLLKKYRIRPQ